MSDIFFEDFVEGAVKTYGAYAVTEAEILAFAREFDPQPMHLDPEAGAASLLGGLAASGWHACAIAQRLMCDGFLLQAAGRGSPGVSETKWLAPVRPGDVLSLRRTVVESRTSKTKPDLGLVTLKLELLKATGEVAMEQSIVVLFARRNPGARLA
ncbi:MaoC family dehydratase [Aquabacter spiritensis]|uniref:Acyl dehydratase n=1 Tax=Aquabacter spiritensis TaxID=933073 RepID=A0A4R3M8S7_9HYPH|nr:MaoC family dehydratase [Aquabacter spiritensis]TCT07765.1 acyl dehydratase [Aquabacter spiritensis]